MKNLLKVYIIGCLLAGIVEAINMGIGQGLWLGMLYTVLLFYGGFIIIGYFFYNKLNDSKLIHFLLFGFIGLMFEWFIFGMTPWSGGNIFIVILIQLGMFSHWASVTLLPRLLLDPHYSASKKKTTLLTYIIGMFIVFIVGMLTQEDARYTIMIIGNVLVYIVMIKFYLSYIKHHQEL